MKQPRLGIMVFNATFNNISVISWGGRGRDGMAVVSSNPVYGELYSIQHYVIKFVSDLRHVGGFLRVHLFPPQINLTATI
jgi:hypothetical protein